MQKIRKVNVSTGVFLLEIPDVDVHILCGCPPDVVKHLFKRGLIVSTERNGVTFESGPNVILLSDLGLQNESFANMAEFPVLQMLYRQGMIVPGHPNNTGVRPLLVGNAKQVKAQLDYIYRGNYGLISEDEMTAAGAAREDLAELMEIKLRFAFGRIRGSEEFIDSRVLGEERAEIRSGVGVRRLQSNVFEIDFEGETAIVDLNLKPSESYRSPLTLGNHRIHREYFAVVHSGEGDGWDTERPSMGSILMFQGRIYLIDAGAAILETLKSLGIGPNEIDGMFHTHGHDDHFAGLPNLMRTDRKLNYYATPLVRASVMKKIGALLSISEREISNYFECHDLQQGVWNYIEGLEVRPVLSPHPVETTVFQFRTLWHGGYRTYSHLADISSFAFIDDLLSSQRAGGDSSWRLSRLAKSVYQEAVNLKKIDIGGGMIHGIASDFAADKSDKIILAHTSVPLTDAQKEVGSEASFGTVDVLIRTVQDIPMRSAFQYLREAFPDAPGEQLRMILNNETILLSPGDILIREGEISRNVFLILSGYLEMIRSSSGVNSMLYAGTMAGDASGLMNAASGHTFRTISYVRALSIPADLYRVFINANNLFADMERTQEGRTFLTDSWLFGDGLSYPTLNRLVKNLKPLHAAKGHPFKSRLGKDLHLVKSGRVHLMNGTEVIEKIGPTSFFGEECVVGGAIPEARLVADEASELYLIDESHLRDIPVCRWKLLQTSRRRAHLFQ